jgi:hypothetical protein
VTVNQIAAQPIVQLSDPFMFSQFGNAKTPINGKQVGSGMEFGNFVNFSNVAQIVAFENEATRVLAFSHNPGVLGSLYSAKLYLQNKDTGNESFVGNFIQKSFVGCSLDASGPEEWEFPFSGLFRTNLRFPIGVMLNAGAPLKSCGRIEVVDNNGNVGKRRVCLTWQEPPSYFSTFTDLIVNDDNVNAISVDGTQGINSQTTNSPAPGPILGEPVKELGSRSNSGTNARSVSDTIGLNGSTGASRRFLGDVKKQFNLNAPDANFGGDFASNAPASRSARTNG